MGLATVESRSIRVTALWILTIPLFDTVSCIIRRLAARTNPMTADRMHIHHLLPAMGLSVGRAVFALYFTSFILGGVGFLSWYLLVPEYFMFWAWLLLFVLYLAAVTELWEQVNSGSLRSTRLTAGARRLSSPRIPGDTLWPAAAPGPVLRSRSLRTFPFSRCRFGSSRRCDQIVGISAVREGISASSKAR